VARRRRRTRAIVGGAIVLLLFAAAATVFALDYNQARTNAHDKQVVADERKAAAGVQFTGVVTAVRATSVTVQLASGGSRRVSFTVATGVQSATSGAVTDVRAAKRALLSMQPGDLYTAREIVVLARNAYFGQPIVRAGFGYVWVREKGGPMSPRIRIANATVDTAVPATIADVKKGSVLLVHARTSTTRPIRYTAVEIVVLPSTSNFR